MARDAQAVTDLFAYADTDLQPAIVYVAVNKITGHKYVGVTRQTLRRRVRNHMAQARFEKRSKTRFHLAIREYGEDAFHFYPIASCPTVAAARQKEMEAILRIDPEYNTTRGHSGKWRHPRTRTPRAAAALQQLHERNKKFPPMKGRHHTEEARAKMRAAAKAHGTKFWLGKTRSAETRAKISNTKKARGMTQDQRQHNDALRRPVLCLKDGLAFASVSLAAAHYRCGKKTVLRHCRRNANNKDENGILFVYAEDWWQDRES